MKTLTLILSFLFAVHAHASGNTGGGSGFTINGAGFGKVTGFEWENRVTIGKAPIIDFQLPEELKGLATAPVEQVYTFQEAAQANINFDNHIIVSEEFDVLSPSEHVVLMTETSSEKVASTLADWATADGNNAEVYIVPQSLNNSLIAKVGTQKIRVLANDGMDCVFDTVDTSNIAHRFAAPNQFINVHLPAKAAEALKQSEANNGAWVEVLKANEF